MGITLGQLFCQNDRGLSIALIRVDHNFVSQWLKADSNMNGSIDKCTCMCFKLPFTHLKRLMA